MSVLVSKCYHGYNAVKKVNISWLEEAWNVI